MDDDGQPGVGLRSVVRKLWLVVLCVAVSGAAAYGLQLEQQPSYRTTAVLVVAQDGRPEAGGAYEAKQLAATYAAIVPDDEALLDAVAAQAKLSPSAVRGGLRTSNVQDAPILRVQYTGSSAAETDAAIGALVALLTSPPDQAAITPGTLAVLRRPHAPVAVSPTPIVEIVLALGLMLGVVAAVAAASADRRADTAAAVKGVLDSPVTDLREVTGPALVAMVQHWRAQLGDGARVALLEVGEDDPTATLGLANLLERHGSENLAHPLVTVDSSEAKPTTGSRRTEMENRLTFITAGRPGSGGELTAMRTAATVLVVRVGEPLRHVRHARRSLRQFGIEPMWCLLVPPGTDRRAAAAVEPTGVTEQPSPSHATPSRSARR